MSLRNRLEKNGGEIMKLSVSSYSYSQYINNGKMTQLDCVLRAHEMGFEGIDFIDLFADTLDGQKELAKRIREECEKYGIEVVAYTIGANLFNGNRDRDLREIERLRGQLEVAEILGAKIMRHDICHSLTGEGVGRSFYTMLPTIVENVRAVADIAADKHIRTCTENHCFISQDSTRVEALFAEVGRDNFGLLVDIGNFACVDEDSTLAVSRLAPYAIHVHAKDFIKRRFGEAEPTGCIVTRACNLLYGCVIGEGDIPVAQCISILKRAGYDGYVTVEYEGGEDCIAGISRGRDNLRRMIEG